MENNVTALRKQLLKNGYVPLPNLDKRCMLKGWPTVHVDEAAIDMWIDFLPEFHAAGAAGGRQNEASSRHGNC